MSQTLEAIRTTRAVRQFQERPLPEQVIRTILNAGRRAQSSKNSQPWHFIAIQSKEVLIQLSTLGTYATHLAGAALAVAIVTPQPETRFSVMFDAGQAAAYMQLAAWQLGVGSCVATIYQPDEACRLLGVPPCNPALGDIAPAEIAKTARKFQGAQYLAGGITVQGMDTPGLIYTVYRIHGFELDTDRAALKARADKVQKKDLLPGDILVFNGEGFGLYLYNGQFLHAARKSTVQLGGIHDRRFANALLYGLRVTTFSSAEAFLTKLDAVKSGCVIADVRMPGLSGMELQLRVSRARNDLPVILISGHGDILVFNSEAPSSAPKTGC